MQKDFYKVTELTKIIAQKSEILSQRLREAEPLSPNDARIFQLSMMMHQIEVQLAIAQQLTMVAQSLKSIAEILGSK